MFQTIPAGEFSKQYDTKKSSRHVTRLADAILKDGRLDRREIYPRDYLVVVDAVLPSYTKDSSDLRLLEPF